MMLISSNNMFTYGEVGERLGGLRESEIYQQSAQKIENLIINEMGNLKIAKKLAISNFNHNIKEIIDTKYNFYICITNDNKVATYEKTNNSLGRQLSINNTNIGNFRIAKMCDDKLFVIGQNNYVFEFNKDTGAVGVSNFLSLMKLPVKDKDPIRMDIYRAYRVGSEIRVSILGTFENPQLEVSAGVIKMAGSNIGLSRIYKEYKASVSKDNIEGATDGMTFGVLHNYKNITGNKNYYIGNSLLTLSGEKYDSLYKGNYFTSFGGNGTGDLTFGELIKVNENITTIGVYQDRLVIINNGSLYFSKKSDYLDFRNNTQLDSAFFFKPNPIDNIYPHIYDMYVADKMYITTSKGVYVVSTNNILTSNSYSVFIASELPCHEECQYSYKNKGALLNNVFYYLTVTDDLRSIEQLPSSQGIESYSTTLVEKYEINSKFDNIFKLKYNNKYYLVACRKEKEIIDKLFMYEQLDYKMFRRYSLNLPENANSIKIINGIILGKNKIMIESDENVRKSILRINPPYLKTREGGKYSNDYSSRVVRVFIKVLNEDKAAIKGIKINNTMITKSAIDDDLFSVFKIETSFQILNGFNIEIISNENNKIFEILGIDINIDVVSD